MVYWFAHILNDCAFTVVKRVRGRLIIMIIIIIIIIIIITISNGKSVAPCARVRSPIAK